VKNAEQKKKGMICHRGTEGAKKKGAKKKGAKKKDLTQRSKHGGHGEEWRKK
jgi:hypothetical protein